MKFTTSISIWEHDEYVVTIRPYHALVSNEAPIGQTLDKRDALLISDWLNSALPDLWRIFKNVNGDVE